MQLSELTGIKPSKRKYQPSSTFYDPTGVMGIEIEGEYGDNTAFQANTDYWHQEPDGSLRNNGMEYISKPMFGEDAVDALTELEEGLTGRGYEITPRCGLHVHLDVSGASVGELLSTLVGFALVENAIYKYVGVERRDNIYCLPIRS